MTIQLTFSDEDRNLLEYERYHHPHPHVQRRAETLWLKSLGISHAQIAEIANISPNTMRNYFALYKEGGIEALKELSFYRPTSKMQAHQGSLEQYFKENPPATIGKAQNDIERLTGIRRGKTQVRMFLKKNLGYIIEKSGWCQQKPT
jgi:transposase